MTSTTDTTGHPDIAELSDLTEGLLTPSRSAELRHHLDDCELCADTHASLEEIRSLLGTFAEPVTMPDDVASRIDAALAAEAASSAPDVSRETPVTDRPSGHARASTTGPGRKDKNKSSSKAGGKDRPRIRRKTAVLGVFTAAALGLGSVLLSSLLGGSSGTTASEEPTAADTIAKSTLEKDVSKLVSGQTTLRTPSGEVGIQGRVESPHVYQAPNVPPCVQEGTGRTGAPLGAKEGVYHGKDVLLVVFRDTEDTTRVDAYVVDTACRTHPSVKATVLLRASYTQP
ncbi:hypothetical protein ABZX85_39170 [Streptomyces sp. NPDC004539]|uniref:anti-sigma factor family protein n=1 Tax=Streptomyces sp. NPDC004539 TaxID=3154280 RepID=UPI0033BCF828